MDWISVKDRIPKEYEEVLCYCLVGCDFYGDKRKKEVFVVYYEIGWRKRKEWKIKCACSGYEVDSEPIEPLYWMPLPERPKNPHRGSVLDTIKLAETGEL